jgi:hypothetical protein
MKSADGTPGGNWGQTERSHQFFDAWKLVCFVCPHFVDRASDVPTVIATFSCFKPKRDGSGFTLVRWATANPKMAETTATPDSPRPSTLQVQ